MRRLGARRSGAAAAGVFPNYSNRIEISPVQGYQRSMPWAEVNIRRVVQHGPGLVSLLLDFPLEGFEPGQFVNLALDVHGQRVRRSYSVASAPGQDPELLISEVPGGELTPRLLALPAGGKVWLDTRPLGFFTLSHVPQCETLWLVATGTGVGPFLSMLRAGAAQRHCGQVALLHGVRLASHLVYAQELQELERVADGGFRYLRLVTREPPPGVALAGRIPHALASGALEARAGYRLDQNSHVMLCGNPAMIADMQAALFQRGLRKHRRREPGHITVESYW